MGAGTGDRPSKGSARVVRIPEVPPYTASAPKTVDLA